MMTVAPARDTPYQRDHERSVSDRMETGKEPRSVAALLRWFQEAWEQETPDDIHGAVHEVWRDYGEEGQGGSALGSPRYTDSFRRYLENSPRETDDDGMFVRPLHAALARIAQGSARHPGRPLIARWLFALAQSGFDIGRVAALRKVAPEEAAFICEGGLRVVFRVYAEQPRARVRD